MCNTRGRNSRELGIPRVARLYREAVRARARALVPFRTGKSAGRTVTRILHNAERRSPSQMTREISRPAAASETRNETGTGPRHVNAVRVATVEAYALFSIRHTLKTRQRASERAS